LKTWQVEKVNAVTSKIDIQLVRNGDWEQWGLLTADRHLDNPHSDRKLQKHHLKQAQDRGAFVLDFGDLFCAMQGKKDRRHTKSDLMPEHKTGHYLNALVETATDFFQPYAENLAIIAEGNHETGVTKHTEFSLTDALVYDLRRNGSQVVRGGYRGYIVFRFFGDGENGSRYSRTAYYHHGSGGGGAVTKGVISTNRRAVYLDTDYVFSGHIHEGWYMPITKVKLNSKYDEVAFTQHHVQIPTYKEEFLNQPGGFHHEKGGVPKPTGAWWIRFYFSRRTMSVETEFIPADK
jgi:hypothetical protein